MSSPHLSTADVRLSHVIHVVLAIANASLVLCKAHRPLQFAAGKGPWLNISDAETMYVHARAVRVISWIFS